MFEIEIISLLNKYKKSETDFDKNKFKNCIKRLILENSGEFEKFVNSSSLDNNTSNFLRELERLGNLENIDINSNDVSKNEIESDLVKIKQVYLMWHENFINNSHIPNQKCEQLIQEMVNFYIPNRFYILKKVLDIKEDNEFESFKNMLNNYIRKYYALKITKYFKSLEFENLGFFNKRKRRNMLLEVTDEIGSYKFDEEKILEACN